MKLRIHLAVVILLSAAALAQSVAGNSISPTQVTLPLVNPPVTVTSASVQLVGNPGPATLYFWIVSKFIIGNAGPGGPFILQQAPITLTSGNYAALSWQPAPGAISYDVLLTTSGTCNCALSIGQAGTTFTAQSATLLSYTVLSVDPNQYAITVQNVQLASGVSQWQWTMPTGTVLGTVDTGGNWQVPSMATAEFPIVDVRAYHAIGDGRRVAGCSITTGTSSLTCPSGTFTPADLKKTITVGFAGAGTGCAAYIPSGICPLKTTISSFVSSSTVGLAAIPGTRFTIIYRARCRKFLTSDLDQE